MYFLSEKKGEWTKNCWILMFPSTSEECHLCRSFCPSWVVFALLSGQGCRIKFWQVLWHSLSMLLRLPSTLALQSVLKIVKMADAHGALVLVDNNIMSPVLSHPLEVGGGECTKYYWIFIFPSTSERSIMQGFMTILGGECTKNCWIFIFASTSEEG